MAKVLIVGAGAAGLMAAGAAVRQGHQVTVLEHMDKPAQKILVTGKGRCNVTNDCTAEEFLHHVRTNPRFLFSSLGAFPPARTMELFESLGVELKVERGRRVFPVSDKAEEIRQALLRYAQDAEIVYDGAKKLLLLGCGTALALAAVLYGAVFGFTDTFVALFNSESSALMAEYAHSGMRIYFLGYFFAGCNIVAAGYLGAVNRPTEATITSVSRGVAAIVTCCIKADLLVLLSDIDGLYTANPHTHPDAKLIPLVEDITPEVMALADGAGSALGTGGMSTKLRAARMVTSSGADMVIANGSHPELLYDIAEGRAAGTRFAAHRQEA